jgi:opacity protein-like surface antigen
LGWLRIFGAVGVVAAQVASATAADLPNIVPPPPQPVIRNLDVSNWYLRGDIGYDWGRVAGAESTAPFSDPIDNSLGNNLSGGVGVGYKGKWVRTDVTVGYLAPLNYQGTVATAGDVSAKISALSALFNAYIDLGTWYGVTPYIGAGVGSAYMRVSDFTSAAAPPFTGGDHSQWNLAWAAMAGLGYAISPQLTIDIGYRYLGFGNVKTGADAFGAMTFKDVSAHEVRAGLRWNFSERPTEY